MLYKALSFLKDEINTYFKIQDGGLSFGDGKVVLSSAAKSDSSSSELDSNSILLSVINLQEDRLSKSQLPYRKTSQGDVLIINPEIKLNVYVLFAANYDQYEEGLKSISQVIQFFQGKTVFDRKNSTLMEPGIDRLVLHLHSIDLEQIGHLWGAIGAKYMPSAIYQMKLLAIQDERIIATTSVAAEKTINLEPK